MEKNLDALTVGGRIAYWRAQAGLGQEEFGRLMGVSRNTQFNYENDRRLPDFGYLAALKSKGYQIGWLMGDAYMSAEHKPMTDQEAQVLGWYQRADESSRKAIEQLMRLAAERMAPDDPGH
jgi:transcriptional regulator with XRE-family HTH domain